MDGMASTAKNRKPEDSAVEQAKAERDRFLAFAFCGNDMLIELDDRDSVVFIAGATGDYTGEQAGRLFGADINDFVAEMDRPKLRELIATAARGKRFEDQRINFVGKAENLRAGLVSGFSLPDLDGHTFLAVRREPVIAEAKAPALKVASSVSEVAASPISSSHASRIQDVLVEQIREVVASNEFEIAFQPIFTLRERRCHHLEALLRLPEEISMAPIDFVRLCEDNDIIASLDLAVMRAVVSRLIDVGQHGMPLSVAVNVSGRSFQAPTFLKRMEDMLASSRMLPGLIIFEITDSAKITNLEEVNGLIQNLRYRGFRVSLDDFGTNGASFHQLDALQVDFVKIDGQFVKKLVNDPKARAFVRAMTMLCKELGVATIAEQVEDKAVIEILLEAGIDYGQGYLFGRPMVDADLLVGKSMKEIRWRRGSGEDDDD